MNESRTAVKVGLFVAIGLILLVLLSMAFSKGLSFFTPTYEIFLRAVSVGGLKDRAAVLMSGITIGNVVDATIPPDGKGVHIRLKIQQKYKIHADARFVIEQIGFLGDQYISIYPTKNEKPILAPGSEVVCEEPFNMQEIIRSAGGLIDGVNQTIKTVNDMFARVDKTLLTEQNLTNISLIISDLRIASGKAVTMLDGVGRLVDTNGPPISKAVTNLVVFSEELDKLAVEMQQAVSTNKVELTAAVKHLESMSSIMERLLKDIEAGRGLAGSLMRDETLKFDVRQIAANLSTLSSNLNRYGILYKPKPPKKSKEQPTYTGKMPFDK
jgi:phospholipid/cholesterol/gamma-HCH transport system substrate-binding protein